jgi:hypothetical protein
MPVPAFKGKNYMHKRAKESMVLFMIAVLIVSPAAVAASDAEAILGAPVTTESMIVDVVLARPLGLVTTVAGAALFIVSLPFSALGKNTGAAYEKLVKRPAVFTFQRPLGDFRGWDQ